MINIAKLMIYCVLHFPNIEWPNTQFHNSAIANADETNPDLIVEGIYYQDEAPISIHIKNGTIVRIDRVKALSDPAFEQTYIGPGLIDHQVNGYVSYSFVSEDLTVEQVRKVTHAFWKQGITSFLPTLTSHRFDRLLKNFEILALSLKDPDVFLSVPGFHLEGPYISPIDGFRGAHNKEYVRDPDWDEFLQLYRAAEGKILEVTIAPELDGAIEFIGKCREMGIVVAIGHSNASARHIRAAADSGASVSTHLGNGCANMIHRHENPIWPQLADDRLTASIIVDGFHLRPEEVRTFYKVKGANNTILVSDLIRLAGMPPGTYREFDTEVVVTEDGKVMMPSQNVLAGASFLITKGIVNVMKFTQCTLGEAIDMASRNPARLLGLTDRGEISIGKRADLVLFTKTKDQMIIEKTIVAGKIVFER